MSHAHEIESAQASIRYAEVRGDSESLAFWKGVLMGVEAKERAEDDEMQAARVWATRGWKVGGEANPLAIISIKQRQALLKAYRGRAK